MFQYLKALLTSLLLHSVMIYLLFQWNSESFAALKQDAIPMIPLSELQEFLPEQEKKVFKKTPSKKKALRKLSSKKTTTANAKKRRSVRKSKAQKKQDFKSRLQKTPSKHKKVSKLQKKAKKKVVRLTPSSTPKVKPKSRPLSPQRQRLKDILPPELFAELADEVMPKTALPADGELISLSELLKETSKFQKKAPVIRPLRPMPAQVLDVVAELEPVTMAENPAAFLGAEHLTREEALLYHEKINQFLSERWELPFDLIEQDLSLLVVFKIEKTGRILSSSLGKSSGNAKLDESIKDMLKSIKSLPALPESYPEPFYEFGIRFTPEYFRF